MCETDCVTAAGRKQQTARLASSSERESQNLDSNMLREKKKNASGKHLILMTAFFKKLNLFGRDIDTSGIVNQSPRED